MILKNIHGPIMIREKLQDPETFPYDKYLSVKEQRDKYIGEWSEGQHPQDVPVLIFPPWDMWNDNTCADRELFLRMNLWGMATSAEWKSDSVFPHLQPWYGVGVYASAFGCEYVWDGISAPQTRPVFKSADEVADISLPEPGQSKPMQEVLNRIRWYRERTHDQLPICLTDTQSPGNTASLLMETDEYFTVSYLEPHRLERLLNAITDLIIKFSEMQIEAIGANLSLPGHQMICHPSWCGISISDDNMAVISSKNYEVSVLPYNSRIGEYFGGVAIHSCGSIGYNIPILVRIKNLRQSEHAGCINAKDSDPNPNTPESLRDGYRGTKVMVKVRIHKSETGLLERLLAPDFKCALMVTGVESREESEQVYDKFKTQIAQISQDWSEKESPSGIWER